MTAIKQELLDALTAQLGKSQRQVYRRISEIVCETFLERHEAALVLAAQLKMPIYRFSTPEERRRIAAFRGRGAPALADWDEPRRPAKAYKAIKVNLKRMADPSLRRVVKRDVAELNAAALATPRSAKMCMIHAGSVAEALLLDYVLAQPAHTVTAAVTALGEKLPKDPKEWSLDALVKVAKELSPLIRDDVLTLAKQLRDWRNLVHPGREVRSTSKVVVSQGRADGAIAFLVMLIEDLERKP